jgi:hypothetical protein
MPAKPENSALSVFAAVGMLAGFACIGWAALVLLMQILGWISAGEWQPVPLFSLFLSDGAQSNLWVYLAKPQPLNLVPSWGDARGLDDIATALAGQWFGLRKIMVWLLDCSFVGALLTAAMASFLAVAAAVTADEERRRMERFSVGL